jgi:hypothetical protein
MRRAGMGSPYPCPARQRSRQANRHIVHRSDVVYRAVANGSSQRRDCYGELVPRPGARCLSLMITVGFGWLEVSLLGEQLVEGPTATNLVRSVALRRAPSRCSAFSPCTQRCPSLGNVWQACSLAAQAARVLSELTLTIAGLLVLCRRSGIAAEPLTITARRPSVPALLVASCVEACH